MELAIYRQYLFKEFERRKVRNPQYSLRAYARDLEVSPSRISEAMSAKRGISTSLATHLVKKMGLLNQDAQMFVLSVEAEHARSPLQKSQAKLKLKELLSSQEKDHLKTFTIVDWVAEAVLKMSERESVTENANKTASTIEVPEFMVINAFRFLARLGLIKGSKNFKTYLEKRGAGRRLNVDYIQVLEQAQKAYGRNNSQDHFEHRAILLEKSDLPKARQLVLKCLSEIQKLEKRSKNSTVTFIANQIFSIEKAKETK